MNYLIGKCLRATKDLSLSYRVVDGKICNPSNFYTPTIHFNDYVFVKAAEDETITLHNLSSEEWTVCEVTLEDIEDFKVVKVVSEYCIEPMKRELKGRH